MSVTSQQGLLLNPGFATGSGFVSQIANSTSALRPRVAVQDAAGNIYLGMDSSSAFLCWTIKYNTSGSIVTQKYISPTSNTGMTSAGVALVGTTGVVHAGSYTVSAVTRGFVVYYLTAMTISIQRSLTGASNAAVNVNSVDAGASVIVLCGQVGGNTGFVAQYTTTGTLSWQRFLSFSGASVTLNGVCRDSSGNVYAYGWSTQTNANGDLVVVKYNSTGTIQWQKRLYQSQALAHRATSRGITTDGTYLYFVDSNGLAVIKLNCSDGSQVWWASFGASTFFVQSIRINTSLDELYISGKTANASQNTGVICIAPNTAVKWENVIRYLSSTSSTQFDMGISADGLYIYPCVQAPNGGTSYGVYSRLPTNSALNSGLTRTANANNFDYNYINYVGSSLPSASYVMVAGTLTDAAGTMTSATTTHTDSTGVTTVSTVAL